MFVNGIAYPFQSPLKIGEMIRKSPGGAVGKRPSTDGIVMSPKEAKGTTMMGPETPPPPPLQCKCICASELLYVFKTDGCQSQMVMAQTDLLFQHGHKCHCLGPS